MKILSSILILLLFCSCATKKTKHTAGLGFAEKIFDVWKDIASTQTGARDPEINLKRSDLPKSYKVAVFFLPSESQDENWRWQRDEKDTIISSLSKTKGSSRIFELINTQGKGAELQALRYMSAQQGADALLLVRGTSVIDSDLNPKAFSYLALLPMLFVEGNEVSASFVTQAVLWDVRTPIIHLGVETEGEWKMERPLAFRQRDRAVEKSKDLAILNLIQKLAAEISSLNI